MTIPDFQTVMLPLLRHLADGAEHSSQETLDALAAHFRLTPEELAHRLPSGTQPTFTNRIAWAKSHLKGAGLLESPRRGVHRITPRGQALLAENAPEIGMSLLSRYPEYMVTLLSTFLAGEAARVVSPGALQIGKQTQLQPDVLVFPAPPTPLASWRDIHTWWLAVEVLSPPSRLYDREIKRDAYLLGVAEYWLVDIDDRAVERFTPGASPVRVTDRLVWRPLTPDRELVIEVDELFIGV